MWIPLESNPEVFNNYLTDSGIGTRSASFVDVFGVAPELLDMIPRPVLAFLVVFPVNEATESLSAAQYQRGVTECPTFQVDSRIFFKKQTIPNACGTVALLHAVLNNVNNVTTKENSIAAIVCDAARAAQESGDMSTVEAAIKKALDEKGEELHLLSAARGSTEVDCNTDLHFSCFVSAGGRCVELDGRQPGPIVYGAVSSNEEFVSEAARAIQLKMNACPDSLEFGILGLVQNDTGASH